MNYLLTAMVLVTMEILNSFPKNIQDKIQALNDTRRVSEIQFKHVVVSLTPTERAMVISYFKQEARNPDNSPFDEEYRMLLELGDDETIRMEGKRFPDKGKASNLFFTDNPKVIPAVIPYLFRDEPYSEIGPADNPSACPPFNAVYQLIGLLEDSPYFTSDVHRWAINWWHIGTNEQLRDVLCRWWIANKQYFDAGTYFAVKPGDPPPRKTPTPTPASIPSITPFRAP